jgi:gamma-D-glutamyl-L-lysine dipeptidyl-peptidase
MILSLLAVLLLSPAMAAEVSVVTVPVANMYAAPSSSSGVVSQAIYGTNVSVLESQADWLKIRTPDAYTGWVERRQTRPLGAGQPGYGSTGKVARVASLFANLYREPDVTKHAPVLLLPFEAPLEVVDEKDGSDGRWLQVRLAAPDSSLAARGADPSLAWVQRGDISLDAQPLSIPAAIQLAKRFLGITYTWGGRSSFGYDCSGFTQMLVRQRGINMPRDADLQAAWSGVEEVSRQKLKPGDLLFFAESPHKITHTGMYIGKGKFIHDTTHGHPGVQISRLKDEPWNKLLVACRRIK